MRAISGRAFDFAILFTSPEDQLAAEHATLDAARPRYTSIVVLWSIFVPATMFAWLAGPTEIVIWSLGRLSWRRRHMSRRSG